VWDCGNMMDLVPGRGVVWRSDPARIAASPHRRRRFVGVGTASRNRALGGGCRFAFPTCGFSP